MADSNLDESSLLVGLGAREGGPAPVMVGLPRGKADKSGDNSSHDYNRITALEDLNR